jgi:STE24 endopeptidase
MNASTFLSAIITIVHSDYLLERGLSFLNCRSISTQLPDEVKGIYSEEKYQQSQGSTRRQTAGLSWSPPACRL